MRSVNQLLQKIKLGLKTNFPRFWALAKSIYIRCGLGVRPVGPNGIRIICYEDVGAWMTGKFAKKMCNNLLISGRKADIAKIGDPTAAVGHHLIYRSARKKWAPIETFMITHLDMDWKFDLVRKQLERFDMGICMSRETRETLLAMGMPAGRLCYINPAQDGVIKPRPIVVGIACRTYADGRKNEDAVVDMFRRLPSGCFMLKIMGSGWREQVKKLRSAGCRIEYYEQFDYETYSKSFMPSLDYYVYYGHDEGSMAFLDALAADAKTIVSPQGFHLDVLDAIDYPVNTPEEVGNVLLQIYNEQIARTARVSGWTWEEYTWRHTVVWDYLRLQKETTMAGEWNRFIEEIDKELGPSNLNAQFLHSIPDLPALETAYQYAIRANKARVAEQLLRVIVIFYPEEKKFVEILKTHC